MLRITQILKTTDYELNGLLSDNLDNSDNFWVTRHFSFFIYNLSFLIFHFSFDNSDNIFSRQNPSLLSRLK